MLDILPLLARLQPELPKTTCRQLQHIVVALLAMTGRITQLGISRWSAKGASYRTIQRFFHTPLDWQAIQWRFFAQFLHDPHGVYLLAGDETVVTKSGKRTFGLDRFFSSLADKAVPGIACFSMALIHVGKRQAYSLSTEQVVRTDAEKQQAKSRKRAKQAAKATKQPPRPSGRPKGSKNKNKAEVTLNPELTRILAQGQKLLQRVKNTVKLTYFVLDGHFGNHCALAMVRQLDLHLISKMRADAALFLVPTAEEKEAHPHRKYGVRLDYKQLPETARCSRQTEDGDTTDVYQMLGLHKDFAECLNVVLVVRTHLKSGRVGHVVLFSSDLALSAECLLTYYTLRFQIEFTFRDAKQHFGLEDFMGVTQTCVANGIGLSFFLGNLTTYLLADFRKRFPDAGIVDLKCFYRGRHYLEALLKLLPERPDGIVCERLLEQASQLGCIHGRSTEALELERAA